MKRLLLAAVLFLLSDISFAKEKLNYTVTSDSQIQNVKGNFEAIGNVVIKSSNNNFEVLQVLLDDLRRRDGNRLS